VRQEWLRDLLMHWARTVNPISKNLRRLHLACVIASRALDLRPGGGADPGKLRFSDVTVVVDGFKAACDKKGEVYARSHQGQLLAHFFDLLDFGRREGVVDGLSPRFVRHPGQHTIRPVDENEDEIGKAIPDLVIQQLDRHLHLLGNGFPYGALSPEAVTAMFSTVYVLLRDTGRRPAEVAGLDVDCLEFDSGEYQLVWHNMEGRRRRRRLPVLAQTVDAVKDWQEIRAGLDLPANSAACLFPAIEAARKGQAGAAARQRSAGAAASSASMATDLELARAEIRALRQERDRLTLAVQRGLGQQVAQAGQAQLVGRINELTAANQKLIGELTHAEADRDGLRATLTQAQDDLIAARQALRTMMRDQNRPGG
jgi:integrase